MTRPRLTAPHIALPKPAPRYDVRVAEETVRILEQRLSTLQPSQARQEVTGARGGNAALESLITALANLGFITDSTS
jgi:hypothetical protein